MIESSEPTLRERVQRLVRRQKSQLRWTMFAMNVVFFVIGLIMAIAGARADTLRVPGADQAELLMAAAIFWGTGVFFHLMGALSDSGTFDKSMMAQAASRALAEQMMDEQLDQPMKRKHAPDFAASAVRLSDEGELVPIDEEIAPDEGADRAAQR